MGSTACLKKSEYKVVMKSSVLEVYCMGASSLQKTQNEHGKSEKLYVNRDSKTWKKLKAARST